MVPKKSKKMTCTWGGGATTAATAADAAHNSLCNVAVPMLVVGIVVNPNVADIFQPGLGRGTMGRGPYTGGRARLTLFSF